MPRCRKSPATLAYNALLAAVKDTVGVNLTPTALREAISSYFHLND